MEHFLPIIISLIALLISFASLVYAVSAYSRKKGVEIRVDYAIASSIAGKDRFVSELTLENRKDRSIAIFKIYLLLGHNYFVELENHETAPLTLGPYETYSNQYDSVDFYSVNMMPIDLGELWERNKEKIVLMTSNGKYMAKKHINRWDQDIDGFRNFSTAVIRPARTIFRGKSYGSNASYIVVFEHEDGKDEVVPLYPGDYRVEKLRGFQLTKESLESKENLDAFLRQKASEGLLSCKEFKTYDWEAVREESYKNYSTTTFQATHISWIEYFVVSRISTFIENQKFRYRNRMSRRRS